MTTQEKDAKDALEDALEDAREYHKWAMAAAEAGDLELALTRHRQAQAAYERHEYLTGGSDHVAELDKTRAAVTALEDHAAKVEAAKPLGAADADTMLAENETRRRNGLPPTWDDEVIVQALVADGADEGDAWSAIEAGKLPPVGAGMGKPTRTEEGQAAIDRVELRPWPECEHEGAVIGEDPAICQECGRAVRTPRADEHPPRRSGNRAMWVTLETEDVDEPEDTLAARPLDLEAEHHETLGGHYGYPKSVMACRLCGEADVEDAGDHAATRGHWPEVERRAWPVIGTLETLRSRITAAMEEVRPGANGQSAVGLRNLGRLSGMEHAVRIVDVMLEEVR